MYDTRYKYKKIYKRCHKSQKMNLKDKTMKKLKELCFKG